MVPCSTLLGAMVPVSKLTQIMWTQVNLHLLFRNFSFHADNFRIKMDGDELLSRQ